MRKARRLHNVLSTLTNWTVADMSPIARPDKTALGTKRRFVKKLGLFCTPFDILLIPDRPPVVLARLGWRQTGSKNHLGRQPQLWESQRLNCVIALKMFYLILAVNQLANR